MICMVYEEIYSVNDQNEVDLTIWSVWFGDLNQGKVLREKFAWFLCLEIPFAWHVPLSLINTKVKGTIARGLVLLAKSIMLGVHEAMRNPRTSARSALQAGDEQILGGALMHKHDNDKFWKSIG